MKLLKDILYKAGMERLEGSLQLAVNTLAFDSRKVTKDCLFIAVKGTSVDGHQFINQAIAQGAIGIVVEEWQEGVPESITQIQVKNTARSLGIIASNFYGNPSETMEVVAVTGTNGKTTVASLLHNLAIHLGYKAGLLSTVVNKIHRQEVEATHTTPDALQMQQLLSRMQAAGCRYVFMEASSHGIDQERMAGIKLAGALFTNITRDHLDYHQTFENYINAKKKLFNDLPSSAFALTNADDRHGKTMLLHTKAKQFGYGIKTPTDYKGKILEMHFNGSLLDFDGEEFWSGLIGDFNAYNLLAIYGAAIQLKMANGHELLSAMSLLKPVNGRFQYLKGPKEITGIVDYAHTPDALKNVAYTLKQLIEKGQRLIVVIGCGGNRDKGKRPEMAKVSVEFANRSIFTSDNPRNEDPEAILDDMEAGLDMAERSRVLRISDRKQAIKAAVMMAEPGDVVLVAGKGHENYQEIQGVKHAFDDLEVLTEIFKTLEA